MERVNRISLDRFPGGVMHAVTFSYDDGRAKDKDVVKLFNDNGLKGTFHLNGTDMNSKYEFLRNAKYVSPEEIMETYIGHEVSCHTQTHPFPSDVPDVPLLQEVIHNREFLEKYCGYIVRGMSYPFGQYDDRIINICRTAGIVYSRTANDTNGFGIPGDFMRWNPSFHHGKVSRKTVDDFLSKPVCPAPRLLYVWGHSYEFDDYGGWDEFKDFCEYVSRRDNIWYASNIEIYNYLTAVRSLCFSADNSRVYNPSALNVWISVNGEALSLNPGSETNI